MTREEAIEILNRDDDSMRKGYFCINDFTAIEVLKSDEPKYCDRNICTSNTYNGIGCDECEVTKSREKILEPCEDAVSRKAVLRLVNGGGGSSEFYGIFARLTREVKALPSVTPTQRWIPVSERLPKEGGDYLITTSFDIGTKEPVREVYKDFFCVLSQKWLYYGEDVIAWMPSPKPYKAEMEGE